MFNNFPYTNFHNLNLDWIVKTVKLLFNKAVFSINNVEPDAEGNVTITGAELGAVGTINNIAPVDGNVTLTASDVGAVATGQGVTKVNGISPNSEGEVLAGTVRSVNGISPTSLPTPGSISLTASDIGALPSTIDPVETVNGISPDANGNVNVGTVKTVNGSSPDAQGNVNLPTVAGVTSVNGIGPDAQGNVNVGTVTSVNNVTPTNGNVAIHGTNTLQANSSGWTPAADVTDNYTRIIERPNLGVISLITRFTLASAKPIYTEIFDGFPIGAAGYPVWFFAKNTTTKEFYRFAIYTTGKVVCDEALDAGQYEGCVTYLTGGTINIPIN